jgi:gas vesicle protein
VAAGRHETAFIVGAIIGSAAGAVYGLLNAPQTGWRTRADLSGYAEEMGDRLAARVETARSELRALFGVEPDDPEADQWDAPLVNAVEETVVVQYGVPASEPPATT